eukprot:TRINITY_DN20006_c0_g1_i2.p1 TRINITY_DN20006_c0_g1~~TRINITY_DN20006_c0_g1_i2.p1  ORF type:complete len:1228 (+),score=271.49 TRINITY_DN20006_c0_g1_i2:74-3757(+)
MKIDDEQAIGLVLKTILDDASEQMLAEVLRTAMRGAPLPAPWSMWCDKKGDLFFTNDYTGEHSPDHPLTALLKELAEVGRKSLALAMDARVEHLSTLSTTWEAEAREEMLEWRRARDETNREYFFNRKNKQVMWESPAESLLPAFFLRMQLLETLSDSKYQVGTDNQIQTQASPMEQTQTESTHTNDHSDSAQKTQTRAEMNEDRALGLVLQSFLSIPGEAMLLEVLRIAMKGSPLPAPWSMWCDKEGQLFFSNDSTGERTRTHPLTALLKELVDVGRESLALPLDARLQHLFALRGSWEADARQEIGKWRCARDEKDRRYYFHADSRQVMWETPADTILPALFLKMQFIETLSDKRYQEGIWEPQLPQVQLAELNANSIDARADLPEVQTDEDRALSLFLHSFLNLPGEHILLDVLQTAIKGAPLPPPWNVSCDDRGQPFFWNPATDEVTRDHPHASLLKELADVGRESLAMPIAARAEHLASLGASWEAETRKELVKWKPAMESGRQYFYHRETKQVMWERPVDALLPAFFLKRQVLEFLGDCKNQIEIIPHEQPPEGQEAVSLPSAVSEELPLPPPPDAGLPAPDDGNAEGLLLPSRDVGGTQSPREQQPSFEFSPETPQHEPTAPPSQEEPQQKPHAETATGAQLQETVAAPSPEVLQQEPDAELSAEAQLQASLAALSPEEMQQEPRAESSEEPQLQAAPAVPSQESSQQDSLPETSLQEPLATQAPQRETSSPEALLQEPSVARSLEATQQASLVGNMSAAVAGSNTATRQRACSDTQTPRASLLDPIPESEVPPAPQHERPSTQETALGPKELNENEALSVVLKRSLKLSDDDELLLEILHTASKGAPLPAPWSMWRDKRGQIFFSNSTTGEISREHPHSALLLELKEVGERSITLNPAAREEHLAALKCSWEASGKAEAQSWQPARDAQGFAYYFNVKTKAVMWESPADVLMPALFLRKLFLEQLAAAPAAGSPLRTPGPPPTPPLPREAQTAGAANWAAAAAAADYGDVNWGAVAAAGLTPKRLCAAAAAADYGSFWSRSTAAAADDASSDPFAPMLHSGLRWDAPTQQSMTMLSRRWSQTRSEALRLSKARAAPSEQASSRELKAALGEALRRLTVFDEDHEQQRQRLLRRRRGGTAKAPPAALAEAKERLTGFDRELQGLMSGDDHGCASDDEKQHGELIAPALPELAEARGPEEQQKVKDEELFLEFDLNSLGLR